ncbi:MAG: AMIN-like domain-containing (lipo)protein [Acidimicrobiales bacterium]
MLRTTVVAVAVLVMAACGSGSAKVRTSPVPTSATTTAVTSGSSTTTATAAPAQTVAPTPAQGAARAQGPPFATTPTSVAGTGSPALLSAVRVGAQPGFDRVVFDFTDHVPGYQISYVGRPVLEDASGRQVEVAGAAVLKVRMAPASGVDLSSAGARSTYSGPDRFRPPGTKVVQELARAGDFEGVLTWVVGTSTTAAFRVTTLSSPPRLVVDIRSG